MDRRRFLAQSSFAAVAASTGLHVAAPASQGHRWQPDGAGTLARIGVLTPDFDPVPESEIAAMAPKDLSIHPSRVLRNKTPAAFAEPPHVDAAAERLADLAPHAIVFAYTSSSYALGPDADGPTAARLQERTRGIPIVVTCLAATDALHALGAKRVALIHPPWFSEDVSDKGKAYFGARGFDVVRCTRLSPARSFTEVLPGELFESIGTIRELEAALGRPVLTANQVAFWGALRVAKVRVDVRNYGRIFEKS